MKTIKWKINGMHCSSCAMNIDGAVEDLEGVSESRTSYAKAEVVVKFDKKKINQSKIEKEIDDLGYKGTEK